MINFEAKFFGAIFSIIFFKALKKKTKKISLEQIYKKSISQIYCSTKSSTTFLSLKQIEEKKSIFASFEMSFLNSSIIERSHFFLSIHSPTMRGPLYTVERQPYCSKTLKNLQFFLYRNINN